ncbi:uncharacterized protein C6orf229 [Sinocyclocheilus grahami]|uniref:uncharacterized protein C6orf229 n=1 Tax=Sinocyclocheilus grahami TaxID=75366 RepID=UPI0007ACF9B7|nr:PREDICTED: uncharacterized protein C6orf229 homolog [Sinocyclocheilus grahami]
MIRFLSSLYDNYIKPYFASGLEEADRSHKNKILKAGRLIRNTLLPAAVRADAARDIGILSYTGDEKTCLYYRRTPFFFIVFKTGSRMIRFLSSLYVNYIKPYFASGLEEADRSHKNKILKAGRLIRNTLLPAAVRADAARDIGILSYTGGYEHAADKYMASMVELLKTPDLTDQHIIRLLEGLSAICYLHVANQDKAQALGLPDTLLEFVSPTSKLSFTSQHWSCYLLNILGCHNIPIICHLKGSEALQSSLEKLASLDWEKWPLNHAQELLKVLGFQRNSMKDALHEEDELKGCTYTESGHMLVNMHINYRY